jgi:4-amino-4-deoxy-L-arabinose transferase-like glycosyltransferase
VQLNALKTTIKEHYPAILILIATIMILATTGTYTNFDAQVEYEAAQSVIKTGYPTLASGYMINQPPLGFYTNAPVFHILGTSYPNGILTVTFFGLANTLALYALATALYGKNTAVIATALFAIVPWHVYISKIFLIDNQALFFGLTALTTGILAVRRNSQKLLLTSGILFAIAIMTKLFAVFLIVPLLIFILLKNDPKYKITIKKTLTFLAPSIALQTIWFGGFANQNFQAVYMSTDFTHPILVANPTPLFQLIIFAKSAGIFLFIAAALSLALAATYRKKLNKTYRLDTICIGTIASVMAFDAILVLGFHLTVPYISAFKYNYVALPFFCLLAASAIYKNTQIIKTTDHKTKTFYTMIALSIIAAALLFASLIESILFLEKWVGFVAFGVDTITYYGFYVFAQFTNPNSNLIHNAAFALIICSLTIPTLTKTIRTYLNNKHIN